MDPALGSSNSAQGWNRYSYALNSPVVLVDRDGRHPEGAGVLRTVSSAVLSTTLFVANVNPVYRAVSLGLSIGSAVDVAYRYYAGESIGAALVGNDLEPGPDIRPILARRREILQKHEIQLIRSNLVKFEGFIQSALEAHKDGDLSKEDAEKIIREARLVIESQILRLRELDPEFVGVSEVHEITLPEN